MKIRMRAFGVCLIVAAMLLAISVAPLHLESLLVINKVSAQGESGLPPPVTPKKPSTRAKTPSKPKTPASTSRKPGGGKKPAANNSSSSERVFWESIRNSSDPEDFREYLRKYPNGEFAGLARNRINTLTAAANNRSSNSNNANSGSESVSNVGRSTARQSAPQIEMVRIPSGTFLMGSPASEASRSSDEGPQHEVTVQSFYMGKYEVTQAQWRAVMGTNPSNFKGDNLPVENVSWNEAVEFCRKVSQMTGREYRLPSEAEWEYACRAGTTTPFAFGSSLSSNEANFDGNYPYGGAAKSVYREKTTTVGSYSANGFGLYDMHGNVYEWCEDWYHDTYAGAPRDGSAWESGGGQYRVLRGGSWNSDADVLRSADRVRGEPGVRNSYIGLRVVWAART